MNKKNEPNIQEFVASRSSLALIFDRDNTLIRDFGYTFVFDEKLVIEPALNFLLFCSKLDVQLHIASNQGGVALEKFSSEDAERFNTLLVEFLSTKDITISSILSCFHHPNSRNFLLRKCDCRKPQPGMLRVIIERNALKQEKCLMIGDSESDMNAAKAIGIDHIKISSPESWIEAKRWVAERC